MLLSWNSYLKSEFNDKYSPTTKLRDFYAIGYYEDSFYRDERAGTGGRVIWSSYRERQNVGMLLVQFLGTRYGRDTVYIMVEKEREEGVEVWVAWVVKQVTGAVAEL